jgi:drug/metabolite transporter (DMT)-like permease
VGALLALASATCYGIADFAGGLLSRRASFVTVALIGQATGLVLTLAVAPLVPAAPTGPDIAWGALSGVGTGAGMVFLYRGLGRGAMTVVVPVSAVGGLAIPVLIGVAVLGNRPSATAALGIAVAVPALWLVSRDRAGSESLVSAAALDGVLAGAGIALQYIALAQAGPAAGIWPVMAGRVTATLAILPLLGRLAAPSRLSPRLAVAAAATGACAALALVCYLLATRQQLVAIAVVLSSLYPAIPVLLGLAVLRERLRWQQAAGLLGAGVAVALLTTR